MDFRKSFLIALSASSLIHAQDTWDNRAGLLTGSSTSPSHAAYAGGRFLLSGSGTTYWHSAAGTAAWSPQSFPETVSFYSSRGIATDGTRIVVSGTQGVVYTTTAAQFSATPSDRTIWTKSTPASRGVDYRRVRHLNGQFILTLPPYNDSVDYNNNSYTELLTSADGTTWASHKFIANTTGNIAFSIYDIAFKPGATAGTGTYVLTTNSTNTVLTAPENLSSLTRVTVSGLSSSGQGVIQAEDIFVMFTQNGKIFTSPNGSAWTQRTLPLAPSRFNDVFHDGTEFVAVGSTVSSTPAILRSADGITWQAATTVPATGSELFSVVKADGLWLAAGNSRSLVTSGSSSVSPPVIDPLTASSAASTGSNFTITATITATPAVTSIEWLKNGSPLANGTTASGSVVSGAETNSLTITGVTLADAASYSVRATNSVSTTTSSASALTVSAAANGAILTPYNLDNSTGGTLIPGSSPAKSIVGINSVATFTAAGGVQYLPNVPANYSYMGGYGTADGKLLLSRTNAVAPIAVYDLNTQSVSYLPLPVFPLGPIAAASYVAASELADNGDVAGSILDTNNQGWAFHYSASTQTYTVLGNVPNSGNEIATSAGGITADGATVSGYERNGAFNGAFLWNTTTGFTLLPDTENGGFATGDVRMISPNGRFTVGYGFAPIAFGGQTALRWDRGAGLGAPVGTALVKTFADTFGDGRWVNDDGTTGGNIRRGNQFTDNRASVWLPSGALVILADYLSSRYGLTTPGYTLSQVTSISADRRTLTGTAVKASGFVEGWLLTLPEAIEILDPQPDLALRANAINTEGGTLVFGSTQINGGIYPTSINYLANTGSAPLTVTGAGFTGTNAADFSLVFEAPATGITDTYPIGGSLFFRIRFQPQPGAAGTRTATFTIASNDPGSPSYTLNVQGTATAPPSQTAAEIALADFLAAANVPSNLRGPLDDPNGDGVNNLLAFALGLPPMAHAASPVATDESGVLSLTYTRAQQTHVSYTVKTSTDLGITDPWTATGVTQGTPDGSGVTTATIPIDGTPRFLRIEVTLVP